MQNNVSPGAITIVTLQPNQIAIALDNQAPVLLLPGRHAYHDAEFNLTYAVLRNPLLLTPYPRSYPPFASSLLFLIPPSQLCSTVLCRKEGIHTITDFGPTISHQAGLTCARIGDWEVGTYTNIAL